MITTPLLVVVSRGPSGVILNVVTDYDSQAKRDVPLAPDLSVAQSEAEDQDVVSALQGLAGVVSDVDDLDQVLAQIAEFAVTAIPRADGAGVTLVRNPAAVLPSFAWAVTDPWVEQIDQLQYDVVQEGPCLTAMQTGRTQVSGSLGSDDRWPRFGGRAARLTVHSALSVPLISRGTVVGALNVYARDRDAFTEHALRLGERFCRPAAVAVRNLQLLRLAQEHATQLQAALTNRAMIDQAIGIVRSRSGGSVQEAFERLRHLSQSENVKLAVVAERLVAEAVRRVHARTQLSEQA